MYDLQLEGESVKLHRCVILVWLKKKKKKKKIGFTKFYISFEHLYV